MLSRQWCCVVVSLYALVSLLSGAQGHNLLISNSKHNGTMYDNNERLFTHGLRSKMKDKQYREEASNNVVSLPMQLSKTRGGNILTTLITIGGQNFNVLVDTGSHNLWVYDAVVMKKADSLPRQKMNFYDRVRSHSYRALYDGMNRRVPLKKKYATGIVVRGSMALETVKIGGAMVEEVPFALMTSVRVGGSFPGSFLGGMMGLAPPPSGDDFSTPTNTPILAKMVQDRIVEREIISFYISSESGRLILGGLDHDLFSGRLQYMKVVSPDTSSKWLVEACSFRYGVRDVAYSGANIHFDSGAPRITVPKQVYEDLVKQIPGIMLRKRSDKGERATIKCDSLSTLKNLEIEFPNPTIYDDDDDRRSEELLPFVIGGKKETCAKNLFCCYGREQMEIPTVISFSPHEYFQKDPVNEGQCNLLVRPGNHPYKWRIGINPFFRKYYVAFDYSKRTIGFAPSVVGEEENNG